MSKVGHAFRRIEALGSASHAWIALLRMIEACARSSGETFSAQREALERKVRLGPRPDLPTIQRAARLLLADHELRLAARRAWVEARRGEKRRGERSSTAQPELLALEVRVAQNPLVRVGYWGWWRRAQEGSGPGVSGPLGGSSGLAT